MIVTPAPVINAKLQRMPKPPGVLSWKVTRATGPKKYVVVIRHLDRRPGLLGEQSSHRSKKTLRFGDASMEDYTQHHDEARKARFHARFANSIRLYKNDHMRPMFYSYHLLWR